MAPCAFCEIECSSGIYAEETSKLVIVCPICIFKVEQLNNFLGEGNWTACYGIDQVIEEAKRNTQEPQPVELDPDSVLADVEALLGKADE